MTEVNRNNRTETNQAFFSCEIFKLDIISHWSQNTKIIQ